MESLLNFLKQNNIEWNGKTFVLAVSTGIDSSVLLDKFIKLSKTEDIKIVVAHVNHNRRSESLEEERYIKEYTELLGIKCYVKELYFDNIDNFQAIAHEKRFEFFNEVMMIEHGDYLVLAHHAIDNIETVLIRMMRGSSLAGYSGINPVYKAKGYTIIRPLINLTRSDIEEYQKENNVKYFEDSSNSHDDYFRNRLRHNVIPAMFNECPDLDKKIKEFEPDENEDGARIIPLDDEVQDYILKMVRVFDFSEDNDSICDDTKADLFSIQTYEDGEMDATIFVNIEGCHYSYTHYFAGDYWNPPDWDVEEDPFEQQEDFYARGLNENMTIREVIDEIEKQTWECESFVSELRELTMDPDDSPPEDW